MLFPKCSIPAFHIGEILTSEQTQQICNDIKKIIWQFGRILQFNGPCQLLENMYHFYDVMVIVHPLANIWKN